MQQPAKDTEDPADGSETDGQVSQAGSGHLGSETSLGGADAVPDTPDGVVEDYTPEAAEGAE